MYTTKSYSCEIWLLKNSIAHSVNVASNKTTYLEKIVIVIGGIIRNHYCVTVELCLFCTRLISAVFSTTRNRNVIALC